MITLDEKPYTFLWERFPDGHGKFAVIHTGLKFSSCKEKQDFLSRNKIGGPPPTLTDDGVLTLMDLESSVD